MEQAMEERPESGKKVQPNYKTETEKGGEKKKRNLIKRDAITVVIQSEE